MKRTDWLLLLIEEATQHDDNGNLTHYFRPSADPVRVARLPDSDASRVGGSGDAAALRGLERRGLIKAVKTGSYGKDYCYTITEDGSLYASKLA